MRYSFFSILFVIVVFCSSASTCAKDNNNISNVENNSDTMPNNKIRIKINSKVYTATLSNNNAAMAFIKMLPLTVDMTELNGNEKYVDLSKDLPANSYNPGTINSGDLMVYGSKTLVLFYKTFSTSYNYTKLGTINDPSGLAAALGAGNVSVTFEMQ